MFREYRRLQPGSLNWADDMRTVLRRLILISIFNTIAIWGVIIAVLVMVLSR